MKFCMPHWEKLRAAIDVRGLSPLVARDGREAAGRLVRELREGGPIADEFDPLMSAHNMIAGEAIRRGGLYMLAGDSCPVCEAVKHLSDCPDGTCTPAPGDTVEERAVNAEKAWIDGPADGVLAYCREKGLVPS